MKNRSRIVAAIGGVALVGGLLLSAVGTSVPVASAASSPSLKVVPLSKLTNAQTVQVSGKHFLPSDSGNLFVLECVIGDNSPTGGGCDLSTVVNAGPINSKGSFGPVNVTVYSSGFSDADGGSCGTTKANAKACDISAGTASGTDTATKGIKFFVPKG
jgi:hypothetical protein